MCGALKSAVAAVGSKQRARSMPQKTEAKQVSFGGDPGEQGLEDQLAEAAQENPKDDDDAVSSSSSWDMEAVLDEEEADVEAGRIQHEAPSRRPSENYGGVDIHAITSCVRPIPIYLRLPNTAYGISMGLAGQAIMWKTAEQSSRIFHGVGDKINVVLWFAAIAVAVLVTAAHIYKFLYKWPLFKAELRDKIRKQFFNAPNLTFIMLGIGVPSAVPMPVGGLRIIFGIGLAYQTVITQIIYDQWLFAKESSVSSAKPPFLLSVVGWFLLATLGYPAEIEDAWGISIPQFCLGIAAIFYLMVVFSIFNSLHQFRDVFRGSPSLTLLLAPPSVAVAALDNFNSNREAREFSQVASAILGWAMILFILLLKIGPKILNKPTVFGEYWAYVFPLGAFGNAWLRYAVVMGTRSAEIVGLFFLAFATLAFVLVIGRTTYHAYLCIVARANWGDPLLLFTSSNHPASYPLVASLEQKADNSFRDDSMFLRSGEKRRRQESAGE